MNCRENARAWTYAARDLRTEGDRIGAAYALELAAFWRTKGEGEPMTSERHDRIRWRPKYTNNVCRKRRALRCVDSCGRYAVTPDQRCRSCFRSFHGYHYGAL